MFAYCFYGIKKITRLSFRPGEQPGVSATRQGRAVVCTCRREMVGTGKQEPIIEHRLDIGIFSLAKGEQVQKRSKTYGQYGINVETTWMVTLYIHSQ